MTLLQVVLTAVLVTVGIVAYDVIRSSESPAPDPVWTSDGETAGEPPPRGDAAPVVLEGTGDDRWRADVERRLAAVEERVGRRSRAGRIRAVPDGVPRPTPDAASGESPSIAEGEDADGAEDVGEGIADPSDGEGGPRFTSEELTDFRGKLAIVERQRRRERAVRDVNRLLGRLGVSLTDDQRKSVIRATLVFQGKARTLFRGRPADDEKRQERTEAARTLREEYREAVYDSVPAAEAETIVKALNGLGSRSRRDRSGSRGRSRARPPAR